MVDDGAKVARWIRKKKHSKASQRIRYCNNVHIAYSESYSLSIFLSINHISILSDLAVGWGVIGGVGD